MILDDEEKAIQSLAQRFASEKLAPGYMHRDTHDAVVDRGLMRELGALGLIAPEVSKELGGLGLRCTVAGIITEALAYGDFNMGSLAVTGSLMAQIIAANADEDVAADWVPRIVAGEALVSLALTEPRGGSDAANIGLSARRGAGGYFLNGEKTSITSAGQADGIIVFARTGLAEDGARGVSAFLVPGGSKGLSRTRFRDLGNRAIGRGSLFFDGVFVPDSHRLGDEGTGFAQVMQGFDYSRALLGLLCLGSAQASLDESWRYINERQAFRKPLAEFQGVSFPLAEAETLIAAARVLCHHTLGLRDAGLPHTAEAAMCKWLGPKTAVDAIHQCLLTFGHYGYSMDLSHQQRLRDVMSMEIGDGTAQIMKLIIARDRAAHARA
ncbi:MAG: acyl-CoA dehydrogenase family protein [Proteobacteria bacterium]|nr:acyl-CoA dehydrogenase family protein [Pseudomonadota bacterium]